jgi:hypothetical protein
MLGGPRMGGAWLEQDASLEGERRRLVELGEPRMGGAWLEQATSCL